MKHLKKYNILIESIDNPKTGKYKVGDYVYSDIKLRRGRNKGLTINGKIVLRVDRVDYDFDGVWYECTFLNGQDIFLKAYADEGDEINMGIVGYLTEEEIEEFKFITNSNKFNL